MCGIFGVISTSKKIKLNKSLFITLGAYNDARGGDSCGIMIDRKVEYGVDDKKLFKNFYKSSSLIENTTNVNIAIGHCRKASVGKINEENAHPICIYNEAGELEFCLIHNGTIKNYKDLASKYIPEINIDGFTDSKVMTYIIYNGHYDVLKEYIGAGVFIWVDYRCKKPRVFLFQGGRMEPKSVWNATLFKMERTEELEHERPLYFVKSDGKFIFSSQYSPLDTLKYKESVYVPTVNTILEIDNGSLFVINKFDRQDTPTTYADSSYSYYSSTSILGDSKKEKEKKRMKDKKIMYFSNDRLEYCPEFGYCKMNNQIPNGKLSLTNYGFESVGYFYSNNEIYFYCGIPVFNKQVYDALKDIESKVGGMDNMFKNYTHIIYEVSNIPIIIPENYIGKIPCENGIIKAVWDREKKEWNLEEFKGSFFVPFVNNLYTVREDGTIELEEEWCKVKMLDAWKRKAKSFEFDGSGIQQLYKELGL